MATATQNLPEELLVEILGKLPKKDLKRARLACTLWSIAGAKWMFQRVYFAPRKASIKSLTGIAANPVFGRNVKELIYDGRLFLPRLGDQESYRNAFRARMIEEFDVYEDHTRNSFDRSGLEVADEVYQGSIWNMDILGAAENMKTVCAATKIPAGDGKKFYTNAANSFVRYARLLDQQESIPKLGRDFKALCKGLKSFRNISNVGALATKMTRRILSSSKWSRDEEYEEYEESEESDDASENLGLSERTNFGILLGKIWPHLTKLILSEGCVEARDLMSVVRAHRGSLRDLSLTGIFLLGKEGWEHFGKEMGQILKLHSIWVQGLRDDVYCLDEREQGLSFVCNMIQWALPDLPEVEEKYGTFTGRLKAGSS